MASPKTAITRLDLSLSFNEFSAELNRRKFIGHRVFPPLSVGLQSADFAKIPAEALLTPIEDTTRAPRGDYKDDDWEWETDNYATTEHGVRESVDDRQLKIYRNEIRAEAISRDRTINRIAQAYEAAAAAAAFDASYFTGNYTAAVTGTGYGGYAWTDKTHADPVKDIDKAREVFVTNCGTAPNALVMEETALLAMLRTSRIEDVVKYTGSLDALTARRLLPQLVDLLQLEQIVVAQAPVKNTAGKGQDPTFARIWDTTKALLCRIYSGPDLEAPEAFLGRTIMWSEETGNIPGAGDEGIGILVEEYREEARRGGVIRGRTDYQIKRFHKPAGLLLTGVTASA